MPSPILPSRSYRSMPSESRLPNRQQSAPGSVNERHQLLATRKLITKGIQSTSFYLNLVSR